MIALLKKLALKEEAKEFTLSLWHFIFTKVYFLILIATNTAAAWILISKNDIFN